MPPPRARCPLRCEAEQLGDVQLVAALRSRDQRAQLLTGAHRNAPSGCARYDPKPGIAGSRCRLRRMHRVVAADADMHGKPMRASAFTSARSDGICTQLESTTASAPLTLSRVAAISTRSDWP